MDRNQWEELKGATRQKLEFSGWVDAVRDKCREYIEQQDGKPFRHADLVSHVHNESLKMVPDHLKADVLKQIKQSLMEAEQGPAPPSE
jgi:hypothetical protein